MRTCEIVHAQICRFAAEIYEGLTASLDLLLSSTLLAVQFFGFARGRSKRQSTLRRSDTHVARETAARGGIANRADLSQQRVTPITTRARTGRRGAGQEHDARAIRRWKWPSVHPQT